MITLNWTPTGQRLGRSNYDKPDIIVPILWRCWSLWVLWVEERFWSPLFLPDIFTNKLWFLVSPCATSTGAQVLWGGLPRNKFISYHHFFVVNHIPGKGNRKVNTILNPAESIVCRAQYMDMCDACEYIKIHWFLIEKNLKIKSDFSTRLFSVLMTLVAWDWQIPLFLKEFFAGAEGGGGLG